MFGKILLFWSPHFTCSLCCASGSEDRESVLAGLWWTFHRYFYHWPPSSEYFQAVISSQNCNPWPFRGLAERKALLAWGRSDHENENGMDRWPCRTSLQLGGKWFRHHCIWQKSKQLSLEWWLLCVQPFVLSNYWCTLEYFNYFG